jgi:cysteine desulfurase
MRPLHEMRPLYFDWAATAPLRDEARAALLEHLDPKYGNASSQHAFGQRARHALTSARRAIAESLRVARDDVVFTGSGSEANLLAIEGVVRALPRERRHVLVSPVEHPSVLEPLERLAKQGEVELERLPVDRVGRVAPEDVAARLRASSGLVSVMLANNEVGTLEPVAEIAAHTRARGVLVHSDASQALGKVAVTLPQLGVDLLTLAAHKFGGPRGVGLLVRRAAVALATPLSPGRQEGGLRGGTEDVAAAAATAAALTAAVGEQPQLAAQLGELTARLVDGLAGRHGDATFHSRHASVARPARDANSTTSADDPAAALVEKSLPGLVCVSWPDLEGAWLVAALDQRGVAVSHGAACASLASLPSHVLAAVGAGAAAKRAVRISMGRSTTRDDVDELLARIDAAVVALRAPRLFSASQNRGNSRV